MQSRTKAFQVFLPFSFAFLSALSVLGCLPAATCGHPQETKSRGQEEAIHGPLPAIREMALAETISFSAPPPRIVQGGQYCDLEGNIFVAYSDSAQADLEGNIVVFDQTVLASDGKRLLPVKKLVLESKTVVEYRLPPIPDYQVQERTSINVSPRGTLFILLRAFHQDPGKDPSQRADYFIESFEEDGTKDTLIKLSLPPTRIFSPYLFAVFKSGDFLVTGIHVGKKRSEPFTGIFDKRGAFVTTLDLPGDVRFGPLAYGALSAGLAILRGRMVSAPDGYIYLLRASSPLRIYVVSSDGTIVRQIRTAPPTRQMEPTAMGVSGPNQIFLEFALSGVGFPDRHTDYFLAVLDTSLEQFTGLYRLPAELRDVFVSPCSSYRGEFFYFRLSAGKDGRLEVGKFTPH